MSARRLAIVVLGTAACGGTISAGADDASVDANVGDAASFDTRAPDASPLDDASTPDARMPDASTPIDAAALDAAELMPCLGGGYVFHVEGRDGYPGISGPMTITGVEGTWSASLTSESAVNVTVLASGTWQLFAGSDFVHGSAIMPGTFVAAGAPQMGAFAQLSADGGGCPGYPVGTFTIVDIASTGGDEATITKLLLWFELACNVNGPMGSVSGCISYGE